MSHSFQRLADISQHVLLRSIVTTRSGGTPSRSNSEYWGDYLPWITAKDLKSFHLKDSLEKLSLKAFEKGVPLAKPNDIIVLVRGMGLLKDVPIGLVKCEMSFGQDTKVLSPREDVDGEYLAYCLVAARPRLMGMVSLAGHGTGRLETEKLLSLRIWLPERKIQKKITNLFSKWDKAIALTEKLIAAKRRLKQGLMQQLLTGKRRFPEFEDRPWIKFHIGDLLEEVNRPVEWDDNFRYCLVSLRRRSGGVFLREIRLGKNIKTKQLFLIKNGDFLISKMQVLHGALGLVHRDFDDHYVSGSYIALRTRNPSKLSINFFDYLTRLSQMYYKAYISSYGVHIEKMTFNLDWYLKKEIEIPPSLSEQVKIQKTLDLVSEEIQKLENKLRLLKLQKQGLMQKLLTGNIRIPVSEDTP